MDLGEEDEDDVDEYEGEDKQNNPRINTTHTDKNTIRLRKTTRRFEVRDDE